MSFFSYSPTKVYESPSEGYNRHGIRWDRASKPQASRQMDPPVFTSSNVKNLSFFSNPKSDFEDLHRRRAEAYRQEMQNSMKEYYSRPNYNGRRERKTENRNIFLGPNLTYDEYANVRERQREQWKKELDDQLNQQRKAREEEKRRREVEEKKEYDKTIKQLKELEIKYANEIKRELGEEEEEEPPKYTPPPHFKSKEPEKIIQKTGDIDFKPVSTHTNPKKNKYRYLSEVAKRNIEADLYDQHKEVEELIHKIKNEAKRTTYERDLALREFETLHYQMNNKPPSYESTILQIYATPAVKQIYNSSYSRGSSFSRNGYYMVNKPEEHYESLFTRSLPKSGYDIFGNRIIQSRETKTGSMNDRQLSRVSSKYHDLEPANDILEVKEEDNESKENYALSEEHKEEPNDTDNHENYTVQYEEEAKEIDDLEQGNNQEYLVDEDNYPIDQDYKQSEGKDELEDNRENQGDEENPQGIEDRSVENVNKNDELPVENSKEAE